MATKLLIPSAKFIAPEMQLDFGLIPSVLLPLGTSVALDYILDSLPYQECFIGVHDEYKRVQDFIMNKQIEANLIFINSTDEIEQVQLGYTIKYLLENCSISEGDSILINFGDTIVLNNGVNELIDNNLDLVYTSQAEDQFRWTTINKEKGGIKIFDKNTLTKPHSSSIIVGLFYIKDAFLFKRLLELELSKSKEPIMPAKIDSFYSALELYLNSRNLFEIVETSDWIDLGHLDTFYQSKARFLNARHFNSFNIDLFWGKIKKKSVYKKKFIDEIDWYIKLPLELKPLIPNVYSYSTKEDPIFVEMEYYGYPTLNQIYLYSNISLYQWKSIFVKLLAIHAQFKSFSREIEASVFKQFYLDKTLQRFELLKENSVFQPFFSNKIIINGTQYPSLNELIQSLESFIDVNIMDVNAIGGVIHGDFCLSNILFDIKTGIVKLIDPRGSFIDNDIYGDPRYDLAKIMHSIHGCYDLILAGNYQLSEVGNLYRFEIFKSEQQVAMADLFIALVEEKGMNLNQIKAIESLLFLSMVPLHSDDIKRQKAFLLRGLELYYSI